MARPEPHARASGFVSADNQFTLTGLGTADPSGFGKIRLVWISYPPLGVRPELGQVASCRRKRKTGARAVLISHALWSSQFGADKAIVGQTIKLSGDLYTVVGVMPPSFRFPIARPTNGIWTTLSVDDDPKNPHSLVKNRGAHLLNVLGRLKPGNTVAEASRDLDAIAVQP